MSDPVIRVTESHNIVRINDESFKIVPRDEVKIIRTGPNEARIVAIAAQGPPGAGFGPSDSRLFVQANAPAVEAGTPFLWIQTGLGDGSDFTFWIEDGQ